MTKDGGTTRVSFRFNSVTRKQLKELAKAWNMTMTGVIEKVIVDEFQAQEQGKPGADPEECGVIGAR